MTTENWNIANLLRLVILFSPKGYMQLIKSNKNISSFLVLIFSFHGVAQKKQENYLELAISAIEHREIETADSLLEIGINENPTKGEMWFQYARINYQLGQYDRAVKAYLKTDSLGYGKKWVALGLSYSYWALEDKMNAKKWFEILISIDPTWIDRIRNDRLRLFLGDANYYRLTGKKFNGSQKRDEAWREDLKFLKSSMARSHYDLNVKTSDEEWDAMYKTIYDKIPFLGDKEIALEFARFVALAGDGHTNIWPQFSDYQYHMLPLLVYPFSDGFYIRAASDQHADLVGSKVLKIGDKSIEEVYTRISDFIGHDNSMHESLVFPAVVSTVEILQMIGAVDTGGDISVTTLKNGHVIRQHVTAVLWDYSLIGRKREASAWNQMYHPEETPLYLSQVNNNYWRKVNHEQSFMYIQLNQIRDKEKESFAQFTSKTFKLIDSLSLQNLIIDIRLNDGGDTEVYKPLMVELIKSPINKKGHLFTIIGRMTYSAAMNLAVDLEYWTETIFVGEPTGSSPVFIGENKAFTLPNSGLRVSISDRKHQKGAGSSVDTRTWIAPDIYAPLSAEHFRRGVDPSLDNIISAIENGN